MQTSMITTSAPALCMPNRLAATHDYDRVRKAIEFISSQWRGQPSNATIAAAVGVTEFELSALFRRWCGLTPKAFVQALTLDYTRGLLRDGQSILDTAYSAGLSGPARLHDLYVTHEAMSPGDYKTGGEGLDLHYGYHASPFGEALLIVSSHGLAGLGWVDDSDVSGTAPDQAEDFRRCARAKALQDLQRRWPRARFTLAPGTTAPYAERIFDPSLWRADRTLRIVLIGSDFEVRVWETLLKIPFARAQTYSGIAGAIGRPGAARAVGAAVGRNPISFVVPCHRVVGKSGALTGYHWGLTRKRAILGWETGQAGLAAAQTN
jgi:AraC family transcriptional regulator, regulatory protein of adaptative response / methylated-DNA-[protein]-cysteine methyltransferase